MTTPENPIRTRREALGFTQEAFRDALKAAGRSASPKTIRSWEQFKAVPQRGYHRPLAEVLGVSVAEVLDLVVAEIRQGKADLERAAHVDKLVPDPESASQRSAPRASTSRKRQKGTGR